MTQFTPHLGDFSKLLITQIKQMQIPGSTNLTTQLKPLVITESIMPASNIVQKVIAHNSPVTIPVPGVGGVTGTTQVLTQQKTEKWSSTSAYKIVGVIILVIGIILVIKMICDWLRTIQLEKINSTYFYTT